MSGEKLLRPLAAVAGRRGEMATERDWFPLRRTGRRRQQEVYLWTLMALLAMAMAVMTGMRGEWVVAVISGVIAGCAGGVLTKWLLFDPHLPELSPGQDDQGGNTA